VPPGLGVVTRQKEQNRLGLNPPANLDNQPFMSQLERMRKSGEGLVQENPARILLIDDDEAFSRVVARFLREQGFDVTSVNSGIEGILVAAEHAPDLVVCDLDMPGMDGYEVLARLRHEAWHADIPVMFLTGQSAPEKVREGMNLGADDYLSKPVDTNELLRAVKARLARARAGRQQQEKQMERATLMFAEVVHDLRDPLFVVFGYTNLLRGGGSQPVGSGECAGAILDRMQQAIGRMQTIVSETLFLAKSKMQRLPFDPSPFDLRVLCEQVIADQDQSARLRFQCGEKECPNIGDPLRLRQALENLLGNALKYSDGEVVLSLERRSSGWAIEVRDHGIGIPEAERARVFEPFFRASNTDGKPGNGLGLSVVKTCVEQHGGRVVLASEPGNGAVFRIELPAMPATNETPTRHSGGFPAKPLPARATAKASSFGDNSAVAAVKPPAKAAHAMDDHRTGGASGEASLLEGIVVDDDPLVRDVLRDLLTCSGEIVVVGEAGSVAQARQLVAQCDPDVVFLDINLPDAKGFELLPHLGPETAVVFVTSAEEYAVNAFDSDAVDYLLKPVTTERLKKALQRVRQRVVTPVSAPGDARLGLDDTFLVKTMSEKKFIKARDVTSVIAYGEYSWVYWHKGKGALLRKALKQWETELPDSQFVRIHRHAIINLAFMERVEKLPSGRLQVYLRDTATPISVSLRLASALNRKLKTFKPSSP
jgi:two-component system LytT family response regulator